MFQIFHRSNTTLLAFLIFLIIGLGCDKKQTSELNTESFIQKELTTVFEFNSSDEVLFRRVSDVKINDQGSFIVRDFYQKKLFVFNQTGKFIQSLGREGAGPGEFGLIGGFVLDGNDLLAFDRIHLKIETFSLENETYEYKETQKLNSANEQGVPLSFYENLIIIKKFPRYIAGALNHNPEFIFSKINTTGKTETDTLFSYPGNEPLVTSSGELLVANKKAGRKSFFSASNDGGVFAIRSDSLSLKYFDKEGNKKSVFSHSTIPVSIPTSFKDSLLSTLDGPIRSEMRNQFPKYFRMVEGLVVDNKNRIWVTLHSITPGNGWFVFSETGKPLFQIEPPSASATLHSIKDNTLAWSYTNRLGEPTFVVSVFE